MAGTRLGGLKARNKNLANDPDFYRKIGRKGGSNSRTGGFAAYKSCACELIKEPHHLAQCAGKKGGALSTRKSKRRTAHETFQAVAQVPTRETRVDALAYQDR